MLQASQVKLGELRVWLGLGWKSISGSAQVKLGVDQVWLMINCESNSTSSLFILFFSNLFPYPKFCTCAFLYIFVCVFLYYFTCQVFPIRIKLLSCLPHWVFPIQTLVTLSWVHNMTRSLFHTSNTTKLFRSPWLRHKQNWESFKDGSLMKKWYEWFLSINLFVAKISFVLKCSVIRSP